MKKRSVTYSQLLLLLMLGLLFVPMIQQITHFAQVTPLNGAVAEKHGDTTLTFKGWLSGRYQEKTEQFLNDTFGFRPVFIRLHNQIQFDVFDSTSAADLIIGKNNYLYDLNYIKASNGSDYVGEDEISEVVSHLKFVNDTLKKLNKNLILIFAPSKSDFFPEYLPDGYLVKKGKTNYGIYKDLTKKEGLSYIDFNEWFLQNKQGTKYPLYTKYGTHWTNYAAVCAADSIIRYIEHVRNIQMPHIHISSTSMQPCQFGERDLANLLNLLFNFKYEQTGSPNFTIDSGSNKTKPAVLAIGDSYYFPLLNEAKMSKAFSLSHFWYYNNEVYPEFYSTHTYVNQLDLKAEIEKHDVILILATPHNWDYPGWGFIENAYNMFKNITPDKKLRNASFKQKVREMIKYMKTQPGWMNDLKKKAETAHAPLDTVMRHDAMWLLEQ